MSCPSYPSKDRYTFLRFLKRYSVSLEFIENTFLFWILLLFKIVFVTQHILIKISPFLLLPILPYLLFLSDSGHTPFLSLVRKQTYIIWYYNKIKIVKQKQTNRNRTLPPNRKRLKEKKKHKKCMMTQWHTCSYIYAFHKQTNLGIII